MKYWVHSDFLGRRELRFPTLYDFHPPVWEGFLTPMTCDLSF